MMRIGISLFMGALLLGSLAARTAPLDKDGCAKLKTEQTLLEHGGVRGTLVKGPEWAKGNLAPDKLEQVRRLIEVDEQLLFRCSGKPLVELPKEVEADPAAVPSDEAKDGEANDTKDGDTKESAKAPPVKAPAAKAAATEKAGAAKPAAVEKKAAAAKKDPVPPSANVFNGEGAKKEPAKSPAPAQKAAAPAKQVKDGAEPAKQAKDATEQPVAAKVAKPKPKPKGDDAYRPPATDPGTNPFAPTPRN